MAAKAALPGRQRKKRKKNTKQDLLRGADDETDTFYAFTTTDKLINAAAASSAAQNGIMVTAVDSIVKSTMIKVCPSSDDTPPSNTTSVIPTTHSSSSPASSGGDNPPPHPHPHNDTNITYIDLADLNSDTDLDALSPQQLKQLLFKQRLLLSQKDQQIEQQRQELNTLRMMQSSSSLYSIASNASNSILERHRQEAQDEEKQQQPAPEEEEIIEYIDLSQPIPMPMTKEQTPEADIDDVDDDDDDERCKCERDEQRNANYEQKLILSGKQIIDKLLKSSKPQLDWRTADFLCHECIIHLLLSHVSRVSDVDLKTLQKIYNNDANFGADWLANSIEHKNSIKPSENSPGSCLLTYAVEHRASFLTDSCEKLLSDTEVNEIYLSANSIKLQHQSKQLSSDSDLSDDLEELFELNPESNPPVMDYFDVHDKHYAEKLSHALIKILCDTNASQDVQKFLLLNCVPIVFHAMLVFHPWSKGNVYHASELLNALLCYWPLQLYEALTAAEYVVIRRLFTHAIISRAHQWKFGEFVNNLLCYHNGTVSVEIQQRINECRTAFIDEILIANEFLPILLDIAMHPQIHGEIIANKYCIFITNLIKKCAINPHTFALFHAPRNMLCLVVETLLRNALSQAESDEKWHKINCVMFLKEIIEYVSKPTILTVINVPRSHGAVAPMTSYNALFPLFEETMQKFTEYVPCLIDAMVGENVGVVGVDDGSTEACAKVQKAARQPLGLYRLSLIELFMVFIDLKKLETEEVKLPSMEKFCAALLNMTFMYYNNNIFLAKFKKFLNVINVHCNAELRYMTEECKMVQRFMRFYNDDAMSRATLHAYIMQIVCDIYNYHEELKEIDDEELDQELYDGMREEKEWNFAQYVESDETMLNFVQTLQQQIDMHEPDEDV